MNTDSGIVNSHSGKSGKVFTRNQNECSRSARTGVHNEPEWVFILGRNMQAKKLLVDISYHATNPEYQFDDPHAVLLGTDIEVELLRQYDRGIVSLAERANCPLMWSHYGDQHHGVCIGYSVPKHTVAAVQKVKDRGSRLVQASQVAAMLAGDDAVRDQVDAAVLCRRRAVAVTRGSGA